MTSAAGQALAPPPALAARVIAWQRRHGRHNLPWQGTRDPYRVWLSEVMLQQTQVSTVIGYYQRLTERFPTVAALAAAPLDDVLALWSGLGYYSRARNLHRCAQVVRDDWGGVFPRSAAQLQQLPGIGRSTAAAIAAFCYGERVAILDGNVRRVLARVLAFGDDLASAAHTQRLWTLAHALLPTHELSQNMPAYTQALMDLGATVCLPRAPQCAACPVADLCAAHAQGQPLAYPVKTRRLQRTAQALWLAWLQDPQGRTWLVQRPLKGIWAGLHCLPVFEEKTALRHVFSGDAAIDFEDLPAITHALTHKDLHLHIARAQVPQGFAPQPLCPTLPGAWHSPQTLPQLGLPAPIRKLLLAD